MRAGVIVALLGLLAGCDQLFKLDHFPDIKVDAGDNDDAAHDAQRDAFLPDVQPAGPFTPVQTKSGTTPSALAKLVTLDSLTGTGCLLVVFVGYTSSMAPIGVSDGGGDALLQIGGSQFANGIGQSAYYTANCNASKTVTATWAATASNVDIRVIEYADVPATSASAVSNSNVSMTPTSGIISTMQPGSLLVAGFMVSGMVKTPGPGYTEELKSSGGNYVEDRIATAVDSYIADVTQDQNGAFSAHLLAFTPP